MSIKKSISKIQHNNIMKKSMFLFGLPILLILFSCGPENRDNNEDMRDDDNLEVFDDEVNQSPSNEERNEMVEVQVTKDEIPAEISQKVERDVELSEMELDKAVKIIDENQTYYELTFKDGNNDLIEVTFDERGNKMNT